MSSPLHQSSEDNLYKYDDPSGQLHEDNRVPLPDEADGLFEEEQSFDQAWVWTLLGIGTLVVLIPLLLTGQGWWVVFLIAVVQVLSMSLMASFRLYSRVDDAGVHYRMKPFQWKFKTIPWEEIDQIYVRKYSPLLEYGGWGIRLGINNIAYNVRGNQGIQIVRKNGKRILIGTGKADEAARKLARRPITV